MTAEEGKRDKNETPAIQRNPESGDDAPAAGAQDIPSAHGIKPEGDLPLPGAAPGGPSAIERRLRDMEWWGNERRLGRI